MRTFGRVVACPVLLVALVLVGCRGSAGDHPTAVASPTPLAGSVTPTSTPFVVLPAPTPSATPSVARQPTVGQTQGTVRVTADIIPMVRFVSVRGAPPGGNATVVIQLSPSRLDIHYSYFWPYQCDLRYRGSDGVMHDAGKQYVPDNGTVAWMWTVDPATPRGAGDVTADCVYTRAMAQIDFR